jgi:site-specific recombinase XerD
MVLSAADTSTARVMFLNRGNRGIARTSRGGRHAGEHVIPAARAVFNRAVADGLIDAAANPAHRIPKPRRLPSTRRALTPDELDAINVAARTNGNDVVLDAMLLRLHTETAYRRGGALALRLMDLDADRALIRLQEKGGILRWQPVTVYLATGLGRTRPGPRRPLRRPLPWSCRSASTALATQGARW